MNAYLNYLLEANICLLFFLMLYWLLLKSETNFTFKRFYLLGSMVSSLIFPLIEITNNDSIPSIGKTIPTYFLPELVVGDPGEEPVASIHYSSWNVLAWLYLLGVVISLIVLAIRLTALFRQIRKARLVARFGKIKILASSDPNEFSFFNYIVVGISDELSSLEKDRIIRHEMIHATDFHSIDILFVELMKTAFWFNPAVHVLKNMISSVHEFQADDQAVKNQDIQMYCSLLARMTLKSAGLSLANHFNKSLTLKRIAMLKAVKKKMSVWKYALIIPVTLSIFVVVACQEQVMDDLSTVVQNSSAALDAPTNIQNRLEELKKTNPGSNYILMELHKEGQEKLKEMEKKYGLPKSIEIFQIGETNYEATGNPTLKGEASGIEIQHLENEKEDERTFAIIEYNESVQALSNKMADEEIFVIVEETAQPKEGMNAFFEFLGNNIRYPKIAKEANVEGRVFVEFVIEKDGAISNVKVLKGIGHGCDEVAVRALQMSPPWNPGRQRGKPVRQKMVMPIEFRTGNTIVMDEYPTSNQKMIIETGPVQQVNGKMLLTGQVKDESGNPIKGANVIAKGQTYGTTTDENGNFQLMSDKKIPLVISFVGYKSEEIVHAYDKFVY
ncbi:MAG TPA: TonB family protein [Cyclobacteriaceae bacterium]|nr:TonB family protein [Cyclobacteriaceae bacterium]